ncbi:serine/threonine-protein phosphatase 6 regulatory ankyrin repeat subunit B-like [Mytilus trossulus]|uniref:serine/threonine-protein phosphatase 6 regulatory ankyrin repeat subunit B-like n=1 Tax=Mytilus trossulus TaxID=6551 RepID=UPI003004043D
MKKVTIRMSNDQLSLLDAIARNDVETVNLFIFGHQICPDYVFNGRSPVVVAASYGREEILDILIQCKCDLNLPDFTDETWRKHPIHIAAAKGFLGFVKKLVNNGVNVSSLDLEEKTALHWAASFGHVSVIDYLISAGASVNATQVDGFTPLHCAAALDHDEACKIIIENDAELNAIDDDGWTPVHHAAAYGHFSVVKTLHEAGASLLLKTPINDNTLHISSYTSTKYKVDILRYLVQCKVPLNDRDGYGNTALHIASMYT